MSRDVMVHVTGTPAGIQAVRELIGKGFNAHTVMPQGGYPRACSNTTVEALGLRADDFGSGAIVLTHQRHDKQTITVHVQRTGGAA